MYGYRISMSKATTNISLGTLELSPNLNDYDIGNPIRSFDRNQDNCSNKSLRVKIGAKFNYIDLEYIF